VGGISASLSLLFILKELIEVPAIQNKLDTCLKEENCSQGLGLFIGGMFTIAGVAILGCYLSVKNASAYIHNKHLTNAARAYVKYQTFFNGLQRVEILEEEEKKQPAQATNAENATEMQPLLTGNRMPNYGL
jgi:hypothetical protein